MNQRPLKVVLLFIIISLISGGCGTDAREIDQRSMITGMAVDKSEDGKTLVSFQLPILGGPKDISPRQKESEVVSSADETLADAISNLEAVTPRALFYGHIKVFAISEDVAKESIQEVIDAIERNPQIGNQVFLVIVEKNQAKELLDAKVSVITLPSLYLDVFFRTDQKIARTIPVRIFEYIRDAYSESKTAILPIGRITEGGKIKVQDLAIIKNHKLVGKLRGNHAGIGLLLKNRSVRDIRITTDITDEQGNDINVSITRIHLKQKIKYKKTNPIEIDLKITGQGDIRGTKKKKSIAEGDILNKIEQSLNEDIEKKIQETIAQMQKINAEPFLIGQYVFGMDTHYYDSLDWNKTGWKEAKFNISTDIRIDNTGTRGKFNKKKAGR